MNLQFEKICEYIDFTFMQSNISSDELVAVVENSAYSKCFFNMRNVSVIDNSFIDKVVELSKQKIEVSFYNLRPDLTALLFILKIDKYVNIFDTKANALNDINPLIKRRFKVVRSCNKN